MFKIGMFALLLLGGCVTSKPVSLPSGQQGLAIDCSGGNYDISDCMNKAAELCHGPYTVISPNTESSGAMVVPVGTGAMMMGMNRRTLIVSCGQ